MNGEKLTTLCAVSIFCISQVLIYLIAPKIPVVDRLLLVIVCGYGFLLVYEFLFKKAMAVTGAIIPYGQKAGFRLFLFVLGCAAMVYGYRALILGIPIIEVVE